MAINLKFHLLGSLLVRLFQFFFLNCIRHDRSKAVDILVKDLKVFSTFNEELFKEITQLLTLENFRYGITLTGYDFCRRASW